MIITLRQSITEEHLARVRSALKVEGIAFEEVAPADGPIITAKSRPGLDLDFLRNLPGILEVVADTSPFKLVDRHQHPQDTLVRIGPVTIGDGQVVVMAGPCAIESREQAFSVAREVKKYGAVLFRGGAFKPRSSPYSFQGLGREGLEILAAVREEFGMPVVSEIISPAHAELMCDHVDMLQVGARNMQNFELLKRIGRLGKPVLLKRGLAATIEEWLMSAEYILSEGNDQVVICERGIRTYEPYTRNTLDLSAIPIVKRITHLPIIVDPSHATGIREKVGPMARAAIAAGADGLMIEVHCQPEKAFSDGPQSLYPEQFGGVMRDIHVIAPVVGKQLDFGFLEKARTLDATQPPEADGAPRAACFGGVGSAAHKACTQYFGAKIAPAPTSTYQKIFDQVRSGAARYGVVPLHNSLSGTVNEVYDLLLESRLQIVGEVTLRIEHHLAALPGTDIGQVRRVLTAPDVFRHCTRFLERKPEWERIATHDAATAAGQVRKADSPADAAITSREAAAANQLTIIAEGIDTNPRNYTQFVVIATEQQRTGPHRKSSLAFATPNRPGALAEVLRVFAEHGANLVKLESRPVDGRPWEWQFYVDVEADVHAEAFSPMVQELRQHTDFLAILGTC